MVLHESPIMLLCPEKFLDPSGHHSIICKCGGNVCGRHNHCALYANDLEAGSGLGRIELLTQPADIVVRGVEALVI